MKNNNSSRMLPCLIAAIFAAHSHQQAVAQQAAILDEVVVTAQRRGNENLQDVPISVSAFSELQLERAGTETIVELQKSSPNVTLAPTRGTSSTLTAFIRGVGQQDPLWGFEPGVGLYLDDVYIARPQGAVLDIYDVERVEILRGPQGTLYGKNTIGGAIKYVPARLSGETEATIKIAVGNYSQYDGILSGETGITDTFYIGGALASFNRDGYGELLTFDEDNYNKDVVTGRFNAVWLPTNDLSLRLSYDATRDTSNPVGGHRLTVGAISGAPVLGNVYNSRAGVEPSNKVESEGVALHVDYEISGSLQLRSISAYRNGNSDGPIDFDNLAVNDFDVPGSLDDDQYTQEIQLIYNTDQWNILGGLYYFEGKSSGRFDAILGQTVQGSVIGLPIDYIPLIQTTLGEVDTTSAAAFTDISYNFNEKWTAIVGGRYTYDKKEAQVFSQQFGSFSGDPADQDIPVATLTDYEQHEDFNEFTPRVATSYHASDEVMLYASYSEGFKSGGYDMRGNALANPDTVNGYDPESVDTYEIGVKSELFENRLRINLAAFLSDYTDMQVVTIVGYQTNPILRATVPVQNVENAGKASMQGLELESVAQLDEYWMLRATVGYIDTSIDEWLTADPTNPGQTIDVSGDRNIQNTPQWNGNMALSYDSTLGSIGAVHFDVSTSYRDSIQMFEIPTPIDETSYWLLDANLVWYSENQHWTVGLHGKNLTNEEYRVAGYYFPDIGEGSTIGYYGPPRTYTVQVEYSF